MQDIRTVVIQVPQMKEDVCAERVKQALSQQQGVLTEGIQIDLRTRRVTVSYDSLQLSLKNLEFALADAGFIANDVPAKQETRNALPPECR
jgi:copper chaperone CopZ